MPNDPEPASLTVEAPTPASGPSDPTALAQFVPGSTTNKETFLAEFWKHIIGYAEQYGSDFKDSHIPPARIKKLVKADPDINMIAYEATVLLNKACEIFVNELTVRAFLVATTHNRRTITTSDIAFATSQSEMFDFLIDIVPAEHPPPINPPSPTPSGATPMPSTSTKKHPLAPSPLPAGNPNKRAATDQSPTLAPAELAVPPPDGHSAAGAPSRPLAVPIPDSELIPPRREPWELAVPIPRDSVDPMLGCEDVKPQDAPDCWELAVPLSSPQRPGPGPRPTAGSSARLSEPAPRASEGNRSWDMAVPIVKQDEPVEEGPGRLPDTAQRPESWEMAVPISPRAMAVPISPRAMAVPISPRAMAVPISPRAMAVPISPRAMAVPISPRAMAVPISPRAMAVPISPRAMAVPLSSRAMAVPISPSPTPAPPGRSPWELAVPITASPSAHPNPVSPSASPSQSRADSDKLAQIDPLLIGLKAEPTSDDEDGLPHDAEFDVIIKDEE